MKIVYLCKDNRTSKLSVNYINRFYEVALVIIEKKANPISFIRYRLRTRGISYVMLSSIFLLLNKMIFKRTECRRIEAILDNFGVSTKGYDVKNIVSVRSVNSVTCMEILKKENPDIILVNGTKIITQKVLESVNAPFINFHAGITPKYRGVHGGFWAVYNNDLENFGATIHFVDRGVDTGRVIYHCFGKPTKRDGFNSYPYLQYTIGLPYLKKALDDYKDGGLKTMNHNVTESKLYFHPTILEYAQYFYNKKWLEDTRNKNLSEL